MAFDTKKFLTRFIEEARKHIARLSSGLITLEQHPDDSEEIHTIFRCAHTIKGSANMMNLTEISEFAHMIENDLSKIRDGEVVVSKSHIDLLLKAVDTLGGMVDEAEADKPVTPPSESMVSALEDFGNEDSTETPAEKPKKNEPAPPIQETHHHIESDMFNIKTEKLDQLIKLVSETYLWNRSLSENLKYISSTVEISQQFDKLQDESTPEELKSLVGDLHENADQLSSYLLNDITTLEQLNMELRDMLFNLRLVPMVTILEKYPRVVRELSGRFSKDIVFSISGEETELDKKIIDMIDESLIQIIRNAIDHGIETPEERLKAGKPAQGSISFRADYDKGMCRIKIVDDGRGIDTQRLVDKAMSKGILSEAEAMRVLKVPTPEAIADLIFTPGLSTSTIITDLSGRGVGMDIVYENIIKQLNGSIHVETKSGEGTTFTIRLPLNTAIMNVIVFTIDDCELAIPTHSMKEVLRVDRDEFIQVVDRQAIRLREQIIPLVFLDGLFDTHSNRQLEPKPMVVIVRTGSGQVALPIDDILIQDSFVIHSLPDLVKSTPWVSGCIIRTTSHLTSVINVRHLLEYSQNQIVVTTTESEETDASSLRILIVDDSVSTRDIEKSILESYGYNVEIAGDGVEAMELIEEYQFDLIISDIEMPRMDGITLTKNLRKTKGYQHKPIILVSSRDSQEDKMRGAQAGADAYIVKSSFDQENLIQTIKTLVG